MDLEPSNSETDMLSRCDILAIRMFLFQISLMCLNELRGYVHGESPNFGSNRYSLEINIKWVRLYTHQWLNDSLRLDTFSRNFLQKKTVCLFLKDKVQLHKCYIVEKKWKVSFITSLHPEVVITLWIIEEWKIASISQLPSRLVHRIARLGVQCLIDYWSIA